MVATHDGVHRVGLPQERRRVGARHLGPGEQVPAALCVGMTVNRADGTGPTGFLAGLLRHDVGRGRLRGIHVGRRDAAYDDRPPTHFTDHAPHEFRRERPILQHEVTAGPLGDDEPAGNPRAPHDPRPPPPDPPRPLPLPRQPPHPGPPPHHDPPPPPPTPHPPPPP